MKFYSGDMFLPLIQYQGSVQNLRPGEGGLDIFIQRQLKNPGPPKANLYEPDSSSGPCKLITAPLHMLVRPETHDGLKLLKT